MLHWLFGPCNVFVCWFNFVIDVNILEHMSHWFFVPWIVFVWSFNLIIDVDVLLHFHFWFNVLFSYAQLICFLYQICYHIYYIYLHFCQIDHIQFCSFFFSRFTVKSFSSSYLIFLVSTRSSSNVASQKSFSNFKSFTNLILTSPSSFLALCFLLFTGFFSMESQIVSGEPSKIVL